MKICLQASPSCAAVVLNRSLYCCDIWLVMLKAGWQPSPCVEHTQEVGQRCPWSLSPPAGAGSSCLEEKARDEEFSSCVLEGARPPRSPPWGHSSRHCLLVRGGAGVWMDTPKCLRNPPCKETCLCRQHGTRRDGEPPGPSPARYLGPWCKL